jgi:hypothetical protein
MTEETDWIGGQLTSQGVPPDEHRWIETRGANRTYRELRNRIRDYYRQNYQLTPAASQNPLLNPGNGTVSRLCCEPRVALAVLEAWLEPYVSSQQLRILREHVVSSADVEGDRVLALRVAAKRTGDTSILRGKYFVDATELGDVLPLTGTEFVTGAESQEETGELHAAAVANGANQQAFTMCFAMEYLPGENHVQDAPRDYAQWRSFVPNLVPAWPGKLLDLTYTHPRSGQPKQLGFDPSGAAVPDTINLWTYRRIIDHQLFQPGQFSGDISLVNWPQNDYLLGNLVDVTPQEAEAHIAAASQLSLALFYWLQTEVPRRDGGLGYPGLRLRGDVMGTVDGLAKAPYVRESRRIQSIFRVLEEHVGVENRALVIAGQSGAELRSAEFRDSVGVGSYAIDLHPSTSGDNYIDFETWPFQIPLGALLPVRMENLLPACKNIGTTHVTSGCYRLHPVEWGIGEAVGCLVRYALHTGRAPRAIRENLQTLDDFQKMLQQEGVETSWS